MPQSLRPTWVVMAAVLALLLGSVAAAVRPLQAADMPSGPLPVGNTTAAELPGLHNVFRLSEKLYNGSAPEGEPGFQALGQLGIRTIISVDGAGPDVALARKYGMRTVHIPFSVSAHEALQLRELFAELHRTPEVQRRPADFRDRMRTAEADALTLERALRAGDHARADGLLRRVASTCGRCHARYRNVPQAR